MTKQDNSKPQASVAPVDTAAPSPALGPAPTSGPAAPTAVQDQEAPREVKSRDGLVVASILIVSIAVSVMSFAQLGLSLQMSGIAGVVTLVLLMLIHKQMQKSAQIAQLKAELAQSRQAAKPKAVMRGAPTPTLAPSTAEARIRELSRDIGNIVPRSDVGSSDAAGPSAAGPITSERPARKLARVPAQSPADVAAKTAVGSAASPASPSPVGAEALPIGPQLPQGEAAREQWSFRPRTDAQAPAQDAGTAASASPPSGPVTTTIEGDLELVQRKIKELADEVNAAEALRPKPQRVNSAPKGPSTPLEDSIGALRAAAKNMRGRPSLGDFIPKREGQTAAAKSATAPVPSTNNSPQKGGFGDLVIPATAERIAGSEPAASRPERSERDERGAVPPSLELPLPEFDAAPEPTLPAREAAIAKAVEDDAVDVLLGPIVTLAEHAVSHYQMSVNLRSGTGESLEFSEDDLSLIGGELDSQFDIARLNRAAALAARMDARDRDGSLLAEFLGSSLTSRAFLEAFAHAYETRQRISAQLVLTFSQSAVDAFSPAAWQAVRDMHAFGFRLALDKVRHTGTDFAALQRSGFRFVRLDSEVLLGGMQTSERFIPADEIVQRATLAGLTIIAGGIQDAGAQKRLLDAGILLGQGPLFGAARQVNVDSGSASPGQSAAA